MKQQSNQSQQPITQKTQKRARGKTNRSNKSNSLSSYEEIRARDQSKFLEVYRETLNITQSCIFAGVTYTTYKHWLQQDDSFQNKLREAHEVATNKLYAVGYERAVKGAKKPLVSHGRLVRDKNGEVEYVLEYSNSVLLAYLRAHMPEIFDRPSQEGGNKNKTKGVNIHLEDTDNLLVLEPSWLEPDTLLLIDRDIKSHETKLKLLAEKGIVEQ